MVAGREATSTGHEEAITYTKRGEEGILSTGKAVSILRVGHLQCKTLPAPRLLSGPPEPACFPCFISIIWNRGTFSPMVINYHSSFLIISIVPSKIVVLDEP